MKAGRKPNKQLKEAIAILSKNGYNSYEIAEITKTTRQNIEYHLSLSTVEHLQKNTKQSKIKK